jgi:hypothetical protein
VRLRSPLLLIALAGCPHRYDPPPTPTRAGWPDAPTADHSLGVDGPVQVDAVARDGRWAILCQAREDTNGDGAIADTYNPIHGGPFGDRMTPGIVVGSGAGVAFDHILAISRDERWIAAERDGVYQLVDTRAPTLTALDAGPRDARRGEFIGWASFTGDAMLRVVGAEVIVRDLATGDERRIDLGAPVWQIDADPTGTWARAEVLSSDTDGDGTIGREWGLSTDGIPACGSPWNSPGDWGPVGDEAEIVWVDLASGEILRDADLLRPVGEHRYRRAGTGVTLDGAALGGPACTTASLEAVLPEPLTALVACGDELHAIAADGDRPLASKVYVQQSTDAPPLAVAPVWAGGYCVDLARGTVVSAEGDLLHQDGRSALLVQGDDIVAVDLATGTARQVVRFENVGHRTHAGSVLVIGGRAIDAVTAQVRNQGDPLTAIGGDGTGRLLIAASATEDAYPRGPLKWKAPAPADPE